MPAGRDARLRVHESVVRQDVAPELWRVEGMILPRHVLELEHFAGARRASAPRPLVFIITAGLVKLVGFPHQNLIPWYAPEQNVVVPV